MALLRGINVGGHAKVAMADLREVVRAAGHEDVRTYVQSGNVVFTTTRKDLEAVGPELTERLRTQLGVAPSVLLRTDDELERIVADNPFADEAAAAPTTVHAAFLPAEPSDASALAVDETAYAPERLAPGDRVRYLLLPDGIGRSKLAADLARRPAAAGMTVRNWRTVTKLLELVRD